MTVRGIRTQGLTEGAILAALVAVFAVATRYLPLIGIATAFLCPLPLAVLVIRHGFKVAAIAGAAATLVGAMLAGPLVGVAILISFAPMGLVIGIGAQRGWPATRTVLVAGVVSFVSVILNYLGLFGTRVSIEEMTHTMQRSAEMASRLLRWIGVPEALVEAAVRLTRQNAQFLPYVLPGSLALGALGAALLNYEVGRRVLSRFKYALPALPPVRTWRLPAAAIWLVPISSLLVAFIGGPALQPPPSAAEIVRERVAAAPTLLQTLGISLAVITQSLFLLQGLVTGWMVLGNYGFGRFAQIMSVVLVFAVPILGVAALFLGIIDSALRVRERWGLPHPAATEAKS
jgi:uncharacterized protein YybS (DUF2232 family)